MSDAAHSASASLSEAAVALVSRHEARMLEQRPRLPLPVVVIAGRLGSGKTTMMQHILSNKLNLRVTAFANDLAAINVDAELLDHGRSRSGTASGLIACSFSPTNACEATYTFLFAFFFDFFGRRSTSCTPSSHSVLPCQSAEARLSRATNASTSLRWLRFDIGDNSSINSFSRSMTVPTLVWP